jgi:hypothetical protein
MNKGNVIRCICVCKAKERLILQFSGTSKTRNDLGHTQKHELVLFNIMQPNLKPCPH